MRREALLYIINKYAISTLLKTKYNVFNIYYMRYLNIFSEFEKGNPNVASLWTAIF